MKDKILTSVVTSIVTAFVLFIVAHSMDAFKVTLTNTQVHDVAKAFVNDASNVKALTEELKKVDELKGKQGDQGDKGDRGGVGPAWEPTLKLFSLRSPKADSANRTTDLGMHKLCAITQISFPHAAQACSSEVLWYEGNWKFNLTKSPTVPGSCQCSAGCIN